MYIINFGYQKYYIIVTPQILYYMYNMKCCINCSNTCIYSNSYIHTHAHTQNSLLSNEIYQNNANGDLPIVINLHNHNLQDDKIYIVIRCNCYHY